MTLGARKGHLYAWTTRGARSGYLVSLYDVVQVWVAYCACGTTCLVLVALTATLVAVWAALMTVLSSLSLILQCFLRTPEMSHQVSQARRPVPPSIV